MDSGVLRQVIDAEKDIQAGVEAEQVRLRELAERARREAAETIAEEERILREARAADEGRVRREAEEEARALVNEASAAARKLEGLDDKALIGIITKRLPRILME